MADKVKQHPTKKTEPKPVTLVGGLSPGTYWVVFDAPEGTLHCLGMDVCKIQCCICSNGNDTKAWEIGVHLLVVLFPDDNSCMLSLSHSQANNKDVNDAHHVVFLRATDK